jgi:peptidoglycan/LPS O-acetylase OafA/YrhL
MGPGTGEEHLQSRQIGLDYLRGLVIVLVVLHHSVLAYCSFGNFNVRHYLWSTAPIVDPQRWLGFDILVLFNDSYFMPLMFLLSGLFVRPSLQRKGARAYLLNRGRRLMLPFALAVLTIIPLAYYPSFRMTGSEITFGAFWDQTISEGPWPSGPAWFVAVLFGFDVVAAAGSRLVRHVDLARTAGSFGVLATVTLVAYVPLLLVFGPSRWFAWGPLTVQASRVLLYAAYFFVGMLSGPSLRITGRWPVPLAVLLFALLPAVAAGQLMSPGLLAPTGWQVLHGICVGLFCAGATRAMLAVFTTAERRFAICDSLSANAFGIYLIHYVFVVWTQYALLDWPAGPVEKAAIVFSLALGLSWGLSAGFSRLRSVAGFQ